MWPAWRAKLLVRSTPRPLTLGWPQCNSHTDEQILDFYHASGYVGDAAKAAYPGDESERARWIRERCHALKHRQGAASRILKQMRAIDTRGLSAERRDKLDAAITYFANHKHQMHYSRYRKQSLPIGSGVTEAACKTLIKQRLCQSGMRWKDKGAGIVLSLRSLMLTRSVATILGEARSLRDASTPLTEHQIEITPCHSVAAQRPCPGDTDKTVREVFDEERPRLLSLPDNPFPTLERVEVSVGKTPYARFDLNDYSIPHPYVRRTLVVLASLDTVRIADAGDVIAEHPRSFDRGQQIEHATHIQALVEHKRASRQHRATDRLHHAAPSAQALFERTAQRGAQLGVLTRGLIALLDTHGASALEDAIARALTLPHPHLGTVRQLLDVERRRRNLPPALPIVLPDDPRVRELNVRTQSLDDYQQLIGDDDNDDDIN